MSHNPATIRPFDPAFLFLNVQSVSLTDKQFEKLCRDNPDLRIELTSRGELIVMPPTSLKTGWRNSILTRRLTEWAQDNGSGLAFDSSTLFTLPDGSKRSPDASWIQRQRFENLSENEQDGFAQIAPDFVIELCSPTDRWALLQEKMLDYIHNGVRLAVLINPMSKQVLTYRPGRPVDTLDNPEEVCCEPELPGFILDVREIW